MAAQPVAQLCGSNFVGTLVLWAPSHQHVLLSEIALFATDTPRNLHIDDGDYYIGGIVYGN